VLAEAYFWAHFFLQEQLLPKEFTGFETGDTGHELREHLGLIIISAARYRL
jgi:hypothetical protein